MIIENDDQLTKLREIGGICRDVLAAMGALVRPGITGAELDEMAGKMLFGAGATSAPILAYEFPGHTCISVGEAIAHGVPNEVPFPEGTLVNIDVSAAKDGFFGDTGASFAVGDITPDKHALLKATKDTQRRAMYQARAGAKINTVGRVISREADKHKLRVVRGLHSHGVGAWIHEEPDIPPVYQPSLREKFQLGQVVTIEPFLASKSTGYYEDADDGWTLWLNNGGYAAQYEHTFVITKSAPIVLTA